MVSFKSFLKNEMVNGKRIKMFYHMKVPFHYYCYSNNLKIVTKNVRWFDVSTENVLFLGKYKFVMKSWTLNITSIAVYIRPNPAASLGLHLKQTFNFTIFQYEISAYLNLMNLGVFWEASVVYCTIK